MKEYSEGKTISELQERCIALESLLISARMGLLEANDYLEGSTGVRSIEADCVVIEIDAILPKPLEEI